MDRFNVLPIKIPVDLFIHITKLTLKFIWEGKGPRIIKTTLKKKIKLEGSHYLISILTMELH